MGIDFNDTSQSAQFFIKSDLGSFFLFSSIVSRFVKQYVYVFFLFYKAESPVSIKPPVGELIRSVSMTETRFLTEQKKLRGMTQVRSEFDFSSP